MSRYRGDSSTDYALTIWLDITEYEGAVPEGVEHDGSGQCVGVAITAEVNDDNEVIDWHADPPEHGDLLDDWAKEHGTTAEDLIIEEVRR